MQWGWHGSPKRSHCKRGHLYDDANTRYTDDGRVCRQCKALSERNRYRRMILSAPKKQDLNAK